MNDIVKHQLAELQKAAERLAGILDQKEVHPAAAASVANHIEEMTNYLVNMGTGLMSPKTPEALRDFLMDNPPPPRSPDLKQYDDDGEERA